MATQFYVTQANQIYIQNKTVSPNTAVVITQIQGVDGLGGQKSSIKVTNFDSAGYEEYAPGLVDPGKPGGNVVLDYLSTAHQLLNKLLGMGQGSTTSFFYGMADGVSAPTVVAGVLTPPGSGSPSIYSRSGWLYDGFVAEFTVSAQVNNVVMAKFAAQATGARKMIVKGLSTPIV